MPSKTFSAESFTGLSLKIRLNPADAKYDLDTKERRAERQKYTGSAFSQQALDAWKTACYSTAQSIYTSLPLAMRQAVVQIRKNLPKVRADAYCTRCGGRGYRDDCERWIVVPKEQRPGKVCFKCQGCGIEPCMEPVFFRRRVVDSLANAAPQKAVVWAKRVLTCTDNPYRPVLVDIAEAVLAGVDVRTLPH